MREQANIIEGRTALMLASFDGDLGAVRRLLEAGADVNATDRDGDTALMFAALKGHAEVVRELLENGADVNFAARNGWTALKAARSAFRHNVAVMLRSAGAFR